ncbi:hypothetical protein A5881_003620 [Enterococcus termitis]
MLFQIKTNPSKKIYCQQAVYTIETTFNKEKIKSIVNNVIYRHPTLRSAFEIKDGVPYQIFYSHPHKDSFKFHNKEAVLDIDTIKKNEIERVSFIEEHCLFSITLIEKSDKVFDFIVTNNHLILDGVSVDEILHEIFDAYFENKIFMKENRAYLDYLSGVSEKSTFSAQTDYSFWDQITDKAQLNIFKDHALIKSDFIMRKSIKINKNETRLNSYCADHHVTTNTALLGLLLNSIGTITKLNKPCIGLISSARAFIEQNQTVIGCLMRMLPFSYDLDMLKMDELGHLQSKIFEFLMNDNTSLGEVLPKSHRVYPFDISYSYEAQANIKHKDTYEDLITNISGEESIEIPLNINVYENQSDFTIDISYFLTIENEALSIINYWLEKIKNISDVFSVQDSFNNEMELKIVGLWEKVVGNPITFDDNNTNFYEVGGNSISIFKVQNLLEKEFGVNVSIADLFQNLTIRSLSELVKKKSINYS